MGGCLEGDYGRVGLRSHIRNCAVGGIQLEVSVNLLALIIKNNIVFDRFTVN